MKNFICNIFIVLVCFGCEDFLEEEPKGLLIGNKAISTVEGLEAALTGVYNPNFNAFGHGFNTAEVLAVLMGGDDLTTHPGLNKAPFRQMDLFNVDALNQRSTNFWRGRYFTIYRANNIINNYHLAEGNQTTINHIAGEAYFLRAISYYWLVRLYGNIPLITQSSVSEDVLDVGTVPPAEIYELIIADLKKAEELLPVEKRDPGRPCQGSAKAFLADVYLTMGGWPINDQSKYAMAAEKAKEVIDNRASYGWSLNLPLSVLFSGNYLDNRQSAEIFAFYFAPGNGSLNTLFGISAVSDDEKGWNDYCAEINFFLNFPEGIRKDITFQTLFQTDNGVISWEDNSIGQPFYKKLQVVEGNTYHTGMPIILLRYAHVLLIYAEAQTRADGAPDGQAYAGLNAVRERAGLASLSGLSSSEFIEAVIDERSWEFAAEYTRWFDLQRLERVAAVNAQRNPGDIPLIGTPNDQTYEYYYLPIPAGEVLLNPNLLE